MGDQPQAIGLREDFQNLIKSFLARNSNDFRTFCDEWRHKEIQYIFAGHIFDHELLHFTEVCMATAKTMFVSTKSVLERTGLLYLMYALYFKQPTSDYCKFRFTYSDWNELKHFYNAISEAPHYLQARLIFWRLWQANAFWLVACESEYGVEISVSRRNMHTSVQEFQKIDPLINEQIEGLKNPARGLVTAMEIIQIGYNEMKEHITATIPECSRIPTTNVLKEIMPSMKRIKGLFDGYQPSKSEYRSRFRRCKIRASKINDLDNADDYESSTPSASSDSDYEPGGDNGSDEEYEPNIGSKRFLLKRKAMAKSPIKTQQENSRKQKLTVQIKREKNATANNNQASTSTMGVKKLQLAKERIESNRSRGNILIFTPGTRRTKKSNSKTSFIRKEFDSCPAEVSKEIDTKEIQNEEEDEANNQTTDERDEGMENSMTGLIDEYVIED